MRSAEGTHVRKVTLDLKYSFLKNYNVCNLLIKKDMVEAAGVEPASENVTGQENYMLSRVHAPGITLGRSRPALRTDKKRVPLACDLSLPPQT